MSKITNNNFWVLVTRNSKSASVTARIFTSEDVNLPKTWLTESRKAKLGNVFVTLTPLSRIYAYLNDKVIDTRFSFNLKAIEAAKLFVETDTLLNDIKTTVELRAEGNLPVPEIEGEGYSIIALDYFDPKAYAEKTDASDEIAAVVEEPKAEPKKRGRKPKKAAVIKTVCYGTETVWENRQEAIDYFAEGVAACEGSEQERYATILAQLESGSNYCTDDIA